MRKLSEEEGLRDLMAGMEASRARRGLPTHTPEETEKIVQEILALPGERVKPRKELLDKLLGE